HTYLSIHNFLQPLLSKGFQPLFPDVLIPDTRDAHVPARCALSEGIILPSVHSLLSVRSERRKYIYFLPGFLRKKLPEDSFLSLFPHTEKFLLRTVLLP